MSDELKPCPFCGGSNIRGDRKGGAGYYLRCYDCHAAIMEHCKEAAHVAWNRRTAPAGEREGMMKPSPLKGPGGRQPIWRQPALSHPAPDNEVRVPDVNWLANVIRGADGNHAAGCKAIGAGALAEKIVEAMLSAAQSAKQRGTLGGDGGGG